MKVKNITNIVSEKLGSTVNQSMIADVLGVTRQTISNRIRTESELTVAELVKIQNHFNIQILGSSNDNTVDLPYYKDVFASCGNGNIVFSEESSSISVPKNFINNFSNKKQYSIINASGNSMSPFINNGDMLIVEHKQNNYQIYDDNIYVFCYKNDCFVKRLSKNIDEIIIKSDNPDYRTRVIKNEDLNDLYLIGEIVGLIRAF